MDKLLKRHPHSLMHFLLNIHRRKLLLSNLLLLILGTLLDNSSFALACPRASVRILVWDTTRNEPIKELTDGATIDITTTPQFTLVAEAQSTRVGSVVFLDPFAQTRWIDSRSPYTISPDNGEQPGSWSFKEPGQRQVRVQGFAGHHGQGKKLFEIELTFFISSTRKSLTGVVLLTAGYTHTCAVVADSQESPGKTVCWGDDFEGQLGSGTADDGREQLIPIDYTHVGSAIAISAGGGHTCVIPSRSMFCWGSTYYGQLGNGNTGRTGIGPVQVKGDQTWLNLSLGEFHSCGLAEADIFDETPDIGETAVYCWGDNEVGQLGDRTTINRAVPGRRLEDLHTPSLLASGSYHTCAMENNPYGRRGVRCWGSNISGQLGNGTFTSPIAVPSWVHGISGESGLNPVQMDAGGNTTCAITNTAHVVCWGRNNHGQLGDGTLVDRSIPLQVAGIDDAIDISVGLESVCAVLASGEVKCWGANSYGQVGDGTTLDRQEPTTVVGLTDANKVTVGSFHACALLNSGEAKCWGFNGFGQLGDGTKLNRTTPGTPVVAQVP